MATQVITAGENPRIELEINGDLYINGYENPEIKLVADEETLSFKELDGVFHIQGQDDCTMYVPMGAEIVVLRVGGDLEIRRLSKNVQVKHVGGDLVAQLIGVTQIGLVGGDCDLRTVDGALSVTNVGGDIKGLDLRDNTAIEAVGGDADLEIVRGNLVVRAGGDVYASLNTPGDEGAVVNAGGDITIHLAPQTGFSLVADSGSSDIEVNFDGEYKSYSTRHLPQVFGDGRVKIVAKAGGDVEVTDQPWDTTRFNRSFDSSDERWTRLEEKLSQQEELIQARVHAATERAERASRRAEERIRDAMRKVDQKRSRWGEMVIPPVPPVPTAARPAEPRVSEEERNLVLQMLQEKKISAEEAERILEALEGQE